MTAVLASTASATLPPPIYSYSWYGPLTVCRDGYALQIGKNESLTTHGADIVNWVGGALIVETLIQDPVRDADIVHPRGSLEVPGLGLVARYELTSRNSAARELGYVFPRAGYFPLVVIRSARFTGSDADAALLRRVVAGEQAKAICAAVPPERQPRPERVDDAAALIRPVEVAGPLTLCWGRLALDVQAGEQALPGWQGTVAGVRFGATTALLMDATTGTLAPGNLLANGAFVEVVQTPAFSHLFHSTQITRPARLVRPSDLAARNTAGVEAAFIGPVTATEEYSFLARIRSRVSSDPCFDPDKA